MLKTYDKAEARELRKGDRVRLAADFKYEGDEEDEGYDKNIKAAGSLGTVDETYDDSDDALYIMWDSGDGLWTHYSCLGPEVVPVTDEEEADAIRSILGSQVE